MRQGSEKAGHKWYARIGSPGAYKYFYSAAEVAAHKARQAGGAVKKVASNVAGGAKQAASNVASRVKQADIDLYKAKNRSKVYRTVRNAYQDARNEAQGKKRARAKQKEKQAAVKEKLNAIYEGHKKAHKIAKNFKKKQYSLIDAYKAGRNYAGAGNIKLSSSELRERVEDVKPILNGTMSIRDQKRLIARAKNEMKTGKKAKTDFKEFDRKENSTNQVPHFTYDPKSGQTVYVKSDGSKVLKEKKLHENVLHENVLHENKIKENTTTETTLSELRKKHPGASDEYLKELYYNSKKNKY